MSKIVGGMSQKEFIKFINNNWKCIPEKLRNQIIDKYVESGKAATIKLLQTYINVYDMKYLEPLLESLK